MAGRTGLESPTDVPAGGGSPATLVDLLSWRAARRAEKRAFLYIVDDGDPAAAITYGELDARARALAAQLRQQEAGGERILLLFPTGIEFLVGFFGCLYAGAIGVPCPPLDAARLKRTAPRLRAVAADCGARFALAETRPASALEGAVADLPELAALRWIATGSAARDDAGVAPAAPDPGDVAYLQYTSGSTSAPRGVMVRHRDVVANCSRSSVAWDYGPDATAVHWMPSFHDYGLVEGLLQPIWSGVPCVLLSPLSFLKRPARWLRAIWRHGATHSAGPTFAYEHCLRNVRDRELEGLDLSRWRVAGVGAEMVRRHTLERFAARFAPYGFRGEAFRPSYGLAEATLLVSTERRSRPIRSLTLDKDALAQGRVVEVEAGSPGCCEVTTCGQPIGGTTLCIVDPESARPCSAGEVGEIWVAGDSVAAGYWNHRQATRETFRARLADDAGGEDFLRTGDLGFVRSGTLYVTGRRKELIIVAGVNHYPYDIEWSVHDCHPAIRSTGVAAFAITVDDDEEHLAIAAEISRRGVDRDEVVGAIRLAVAEQHELDAFAIALLAPGSVPKTSSGKLQRSVCRDRLLRGELRPLHLWSRRAGALGASGAGPADAPSASLPRRSEIAGWLRRRLGQIADLDPDDVDIGAPFASLGLASRQAIRLVGELEEWLRRPVDATALWSHPTIRDLCEHLAPDGPQPRPAAGPPSPAAREGDREPVAIVGIACRFPGAPGRQAFWQLLTGGTCAVTEVPADRWDVDALYDPDPSVPGKMTTRWGGFLEGLDLFDAEFFGISPREANHLDPRQRLLLELGWEALEDAGIAPDRLAGSRTGVFVATLTDDYGTILFGHHPSRIDAYSGAGTAHSVTANRLSYFLDLKGPSVALDTACSGSLVTLHLACQSLRNGECSLALAGGVSVILDPGANIFFSKAGALAADGRCKTFDHRADGIVRSEGAGMLVLKPLSRALVDGDPIYATILGSAVNHDGRSNGIMAPNGKAQEALLRDAQRDAGVAAESVQYVEAHGTGTSLGDPIEVSALGAVLAEGRDPNRPCALGSVKTNLGHMEPAAGVAGVIKVALAIRHRRLPATLHFERPNPLIPFDNWPFLRVQTELAPWPSPERPLLAGVSSFGIGGTNAHVVLGQAPTAADDRASGAPPSAFLLPISARSHAALAATAEDYQRLLERIDDSGALRDLCHTASVRRAHMPRRAAFAGTTAEEIAAGVAAWLEAHAETEVSAVRGEPKIAFVFSGQGSHWLGMGRSLYRREVEFRRVIDRIDAAISARAGWSLRSELFARPEESRLSRTEVAQPAVFAMQTALDALWRSWGVRPAAVVGQSLGEVAAARAAGMLSLEAAVDVVLHRSRLMQRVAGRGATAVVGLKPDAAWEAIAAEGEALSVAGSSSPETTVVSGDREALGRVLAELEKRGVFGRLLRDIDVAFHSAQMDPLVPELIASLAALRTRLPELPWYSSVDAARVDAAAADAEYWGRNLRQPFRFADTVARLVEDGYELFLEVSPHAVLGGAIRQVLAAQDRSGLVFGSLRRDLDERMALLETLAEIYVAGAAVDWPRVAGDGRHVDLPPYRWQRERFWLDRISDAPTAHAAAQSSSGHPLLGGLLQSALRAGQSFWQMELGAHSLHYLDEHRVHGAVVLPGTTYLEMAGEAAARALDCDVCKLESVRFERPLFLSADHARQVQVAVTPENAEQAVFCVSSRSSADAANGAWTVHARGNARVASAEDGTRIDVSAVRRRCAEAVSAEDHYGRMQERGLQYGPSFRAVGGIQRRAGEALAEIRIPASVEPELARYRLHPILLDAGLQVVASTIPETDGKGSETFLPVGVEAFEIARPQAAIGMCHAALGEMPTDGGPYRCDVRFADREGRVTATLSGVSFQRLDEAQRTLRDRPADWMYSLRWEARPCAEVDALRDEASDEASTWLIFAAAGGLGDALAERVRARGDLPIRIAPGKRFARAADGRRFRVRPDRRQDLDRVLAVAAEDGWPAVSRAIDLRGLGLPADDDLGERFDQVTTLTFDAVRSLVDALDAMPGSPRLWLITRGAQPVGDGPAPTAAGQALLWGLGKAIAHQEHPDRWGGIIDLDPAASARDAELLIGEILDPGDEDAVAYRGGERYVPRLVHGHRDDRRKKPVAFRADATYLITGGLGDLALATARWMIERGAHRLLLLARAPLPPRTAWREGVEDRRTRHRIETVRSLEAMGAAVHVIGVDVADRDALAAALARFEEECWPPVRGVVHTAGVVRDRLLLAQEPGDVDAVLRPKALGAWNLHLLFRDRPLDFFVLYSSAAAILVPPGQSAYGAANAFLDALAHRRRGAGLPALSLNWGSWRDLGMAARLKMVDPLERVGARAMSPQLGIELLAHAFQREDAQIGLFDADWPTILERFFPPGVRPRMLEHLEHDRREAAVTEDDRERREELFRTLEDADDPVERREVLQAFLVDLAAGVLRLERQRIDPDEPLNALGIDSIMAVELKNCIESDLGVSIPMIEWLQGPSLTETTEKIEAQLRLENDLVRAEDEVRSEAESHDSNIEQGRPSAA